MRMYIGGHQVVNDFDFVELALGTPVELWLGVDGESEMERAARLDAARDILAENPGFPDDAIRVAAAAIEEQAPELFNVVPLAQAMPRFRRVRRGAAA
ncbi:hypothetical protein QZH56_16440 [Streptomyces olivoreticuli]|uniref:hypothetical protein n=1 Tax=Streptomyces olivoreticuli TaxID=68246 RepID=UPI002658A4CA|nr:hypothetical protein [Streptomyces olivoreticuli]WKK27035.1 hypothetical protein QZH56_16440 [Streptomyces olivoreticuli]